MTTEMGELGAVNSNGIVSTEEELFSLVWKSSPPPDPASISKECLSAAEEAAEQVLNCIHPTLDSEEKRRDVIDYVQQLVKSHLNCEVVSYGSVPLKTYLSDGDIDLTVLKGPNAEESLAHDVLSLFLEEEKNQDAEYQVKDTQFIDAEVKLVKCLVRNIVIDISFNQLGGLSTLCFLEQVDRLVGRNHLFKRSIILVKTWCYYESRILGAHHGLISTYALETLVLYIFHLFHSSLSGPLEVLYRFLDYFSQFDWDNYCISLKGPVCKSSLPDVVVKMPENAQNDLLLSEGFLENCMVMFSVASRGPEANQKAFQTKHINIIDPLKENNNLGRSVHRGNFYRIRSAFKYGARKLGQVLLQPKDKVADEILKFFSNTRSRHENEYTSCSFRRLTIDFGDEDSLTTPSISSPVELLSDDDILLESPVSDIDCDSLSAEQTHALDNCISSSNYSASLSENNNHFYKPNYSSSKSSAENGSSESNGINSWLEMKNNKSNNTYRWCMDNSKGNNLENVSLDFREMDSISVGEGSEVFNPLADLSGDYDSHIRNLLRGQFCHGFALCSNLVRKAPSSLPSRRIQNKKPWDIVRQCLPLRQNKSSETSPHTISMDHTMSSAAAADCALLGTAFQFEGKQKSRGTGTYFPHMNVFYMERPSSHGGSRNKAGPPGKHNNLHTYGHSNNGLYSADSNNNNNNNSFEYSSHDARSRYQGRSRKRSDVQCQSPRGSQINGYLSKSCRIEFGSIGNLAEEVISGSAQVRDSTRDVSMKKQGSMPIMLQERVAGQSIHLKNEDEFPPLCQ